AAPPARRLPAASRVSAPKSPLAVPPPHAAPRYFTPRRPTSRGGAGLYDQGELGQAAHVDADVTLGAGLVDGEVREPAQQLLEGHPGLQPRQRRAQAQMPAEAEAHVPVDVAADVEHVRFWILALVVDRRAGHQDHPLL